MSTLTRDARAIRLNCDRLPSGESVICVHGKLDSSTAEALRGVLRGIEARDVGDIVVVGGSIESIDREGVGVLVAALRRLRLQNRDLFVTRPSSTVLRALRMLNLHRALITGGRLPMSWVDPCL